MRSTLGMSVLAFATVMLLLSATFFVLAQSVGRSACREDPTLAKSCEARSEVVFRHSETAYFLLFGSLFMALVATGAWMWDIKRQQTQSAMPAMPTMDRV